MSSVKTAAVGEYSSVILFGAAGIETRSAANPEEAEKAIASLVKEGYKVIFLAEKFAEKMPETLEKYRAEAFPLILPVPDRTGATGYIMDKIKSNMEKAIGTNILDN